MTEVRQTDPVTGAQKGQKDAQVGALDPLAILKVGEVAGFGTVKYERFNFMKGFPYHWSYDALQRHLNLFWAGEDLDEESGLPHIAHAAWQCLALLSFQLRDRGTDDRPHVMLAEADAKIADAEFDNTPLGKLMNSITYTVNPVVSNPDRVTVDEDDLDWIPTEEM